MIDLKRLIARLHAEHETLTRNAEAATDSTLREVLRDDAAARIEDIKILRDALAHGRKPEWSMLNCAPSLYAAIGKEVA